MAQFTEAEAREIFASRFTTYAQTYHKSVYNTLHKRNLVAAPEGTKPSSIVTRVPAVDIFEFLQSSYLMAQAQTGFDTGYRFNINDFSSFALQIQGGYQGKGGPSSWVLNPMLDEVIQSNGSVSSLQQDVLRQQMTELLDSPMKLIDRSVKPRQLKSLMKQVQQKNTSFLSYDLYNRSSDIGQLSKRVLDEDFYHEHKWANIEEALYRYNQTEDISAQRKRVPVLDVERELIDKYADELDAATNDGMRSLIVSKKEDSDAIIRATKSDRMHLQVIQNVLMDAKKSGESIQTVLQKDSFKDTFVAQTILGELTEGATDSSALLQMEMFMTKKDILNYPTAMHGLERKSISTMRNAVTQLISASYDPDHPAYADYHRAKQFKTDYNLMISQLVEQKAEHAVEFKAWMNFQNSNSGMEGWGYTLGSDAKKAIAQGIKEGSEARIAEHQAFVEQLRNDGLSEEEIKAAIDARDAEAAAARPVKTDAEVDYEMEQIVKKTSGAAFSNSMSQDEMSALHAYTKHFTEMDEANKYFAQKHQESMQKDEIKLQSPLNQIRAALDQKLQEVDTDTSNRLSGALIDSIQKNDVDAYVEVMQELHPDLTERYYGDTASIRTEFDELRELYDVDSSKFSLQLIRPTIIGTKNSETWTRFAVDGVAVRVPGDKVAHQVTDFSDGYVSLEAEHVVANKLNVRTSMSPDEAREKIAGTLEDVEAIRQESLLTNERQRLRDTQKIDEVFVEVLFKKRALAEDINVENEFYRQKLIDQEKVFEDVAVKSNIATNGTVSRTVSVSNLLEQYNSYMKRMDPMLFDKTSKTRVDNRLPAFLQDMITTHASWMQTIGNASELQGMAYESLANAFQDFAQTSTPINLTDEGFARKWELEGRTLSEIEQMQSALANKGMKERLDDYVFTNVLTHMHRNWFSEASKGQRDSAVDNLLTEVRDKLLANGQLANHDNYTGSAEQIKHSLGSIRSTINKFAHYQEAANLSVNEIAERLATRDQGKGLNVQFEDYMERVLESTDADDDYNSKAYENNPRIKVEGVESLGTEELTEIVDGDSTQYIKDLTPEKQEQMIQHLTTEGIGGGSKATIETLMDLETAMGRDKVYFDDGNEGGYIYRGSSGDLLAYYPDADRTVKVVDNVEEAQSRFHTSQLQPKLHYGTQQITEDIGEAGALQRGGFGSYEELQRRGQSAVQSDPNETVRLAKQFMGGSQNAVYLDMETTGLSGSPLDEDLIRPLEVVAQRKRWDPELNQIVTDPNDSLHIIMRPNEKIMGYLDELVANNDFNINVGGNTYSIMDYMHEEDVFKSGGGLANRTIFKEIAFSPNAKDLLDEVEKKKADVWFMRNIAKYGLVGADSPEDMLRFMQHTGAEAVPQGGGGAYLARLMEDAQQGISNLNNAGLQGEGRVVFADNQIVLSDYGSMVKQVKDFVGDNILVGQNVAEADWAKVIDLANENIGVQQQAYVGEASKVIQQIADRNHEIQLAQYKNLLDELGVDELYRYNPPAKEITNRQVDSYKLNPEWDGHIYGIREKNKDGTYTRMQNFRLLEAGAVADGAVSVGDVVNVFDPKSAEWLQQAGLVRNASNISDAEMDALFERQMAPVTGSKYIPNKVTEESFIRQQRSETVSPAKLDFLLNQGIRNELGISKKELTEIMETEPERYQSLRDAQTAKMIDNFQLEPIINTHDVITASHIEGLEDALTHYVDDINQREAILTPMYQNASFNDLTINPTAVANKVGTGIPSQESNLLFQAANRLGIDTSALTQAEQSFNEARQLPQGLSQQPIMEQMFLSKLANPNEISHRAEAQIAAAGLTQSQNLHRADADVAQGIEVVQSHLQKLNDNADFVSFDPNQPVQAGDVFHHHRQIREDVPLGMYEFVGMNDSDNSYTVRSLMPDGQEYTIANPSKLERNRGFSRSFDFSGVAGSPEVQEAVANYNHDVAREQLSKINNSPYAYDLHQLQANNQMIPNLMRMKNAYDNTINQAELADLRQQQSQPMSETAREVLNHRISQLEAMPTPTLDRTVRHVAASSPNLLDTAGYNDWVNKEVTPRQAQAYDQTKGFYDSDFGVQQGKFLSDVDNMQKAGVINRSEGKEMIRNMNDQIKEMARQKGFTRQTPGKSAMGVLGEQFGRFAGSPMVLNTSSHKALTQSIWSQAEKMKGLIDSSLPENEQKKRVLNQFILPHLKANNFISPLEDGNMPSVSAAASQILANPSKLEPLEELDYLKFNEMSKDAEFMDHIKGVSNELVSSKMETATPMQQSRMELRNQMITDLKEQDMYHPELRINPKMEDVVENTINFKGFDKLTDYTPKELKQVADQLDASYSTDADLKNRIYNQLFREATAGRPNSLEGMLGNGVEPRRLEAMQALNWVDKDGTPLPVSEHILGAIPNGAKARQYASWKVGDLPRELLNKIVAGDMSGYNKGDGTDYMYQRIGEWVNSGAEGRRNTAPDRMAKVQTVNPESVINGTVEEPTTIFGTEVTEEMARAKQANRDYVRTGGLNVIEELGESTYRTRGAIENAIDNVKTQYDNYATAIKGSGIGKGAMWVAGIGLAAYALHQFAESGDPLKFERKSVKDDVRSIAGEGDNNGSPPSTNISTGGTSYETLPGGGGSKGQRIRVSGKTDNEESLLRMQEHVNQNMNQANLSIQDSRETLDRNWLDNQFSQFIELGHV